MEINKKKHQIEVGVPSLPKGYSTTTITATPDEVERVPVDIEEIKRQNYTEWSKKNYIPGVTPNPVIEEAIKPKEDRVNHPSHYTWLKELCGIEVIDITRHMDFDLGNAIKYILRAGHKKEEGYNDKEKEIEDIKKSIYYLNDYINNVLNDKR